MTEGATYQTLAEVESITESTTPDDDIDGGKFILINDGEKVKVGRGVNSLVTLSGDKTEDMKKIKIIDSLDLIRDDIKASFEENYINVVNSHENKMLFIGVGVVEELLFEVVKEIEDVVVTAVKGNHAEHSVTLLLHHLLWAVPGGSRAGRVYEICNLEAGVLAVSPDVSGNLLSTVDILLRFYE